MKRNIVCILLSAVLLISAVIPYLLSTGTSFIYALKDENSAPAPEGYPTQPMIIEEQKIAEEKRIADEKLKAKINSETRAIWVSYLAMQNINTRTIDKMVADCVQMKINTVFFHVRPFGDAMYKSEIFPWSHLITGEQGKAPENDFDPLKYMTEKCRQNNIKIHAWVNPLRIRLSSQNPVVAESNPAYMILNDDNKENDRLVIEYKNGWYYNPARPEAREIIVKGVAEILRNYDVDGIHFDDYFYPAEDESFADSAEYNQYKTSGGKADLQQWRRENINRLIAEVYKTVKSNKNGAVFGISPAGNIENCMKIGADVKTWCSSDGYVDYICPQIYWNFEHKTLPFDKACSQWESLVTNKNIKLYAGLALYKTGSDLDDGTWLTSDDNIKRQIEFLRESEKFEGFSLYSYRCIAKNECQKEIAAYKTL